ncbi:MAG: DNA methyltransferase [Deltaproteobacteria bacterium]
MDINDIQKKLNSVNWNFDFTINYDSGMIRPFNCRKYYSYPATFIPEIPYTLIEILSKKGDVILDPYGGIGTTFMQAISLERIAFSYDINPIATNVCENLYRLFNPNFKHQEVKNQLLDLCCDYDDNQNYRNWLTKYQRELTDWFEKNTFNQLAFLLNKYENIQDDSIRIVLGLVLPSILTTLSSQNKGWAYIADNVKPKSDELRQKNVFDQYKFAVKALLGDVENQLKNLTDTYPSFYQSLTGNQRVIANSIVNSNLDNESIDLIITSPPYPRMIDYVKSQRLSFYFSKLNFHDYVESETGARYRRSRQDTLIKYKEQIIDVNRKMLDLLKCGGFLCLVLPDYNGGDDRKIVMEDIAKWYSENGLKEISKIGRYIPSHKRTLSIQWASLVNEHLYIFQKG